MHVLSVHYIAIFFLEIHKINLGRTCFDRAGLKWETNNIFFRPIHGHMGWGFIECYPKFTSRSSQGHNNVKSARKGKNS